MASAVSVLSAAARRLEGKVALITGGSSGIGASTARLFCQHGAKVVIADIQDDLGHSICKDLGTANASYVHCNVTNESDVQNAVNKSVAEHGRLDIMFNNAGIINPKPTTILEEDKSEFENIFSVNVLGAFLGTKHAASVMIPARRGSIINTASCASVIGGVATHAYTCSKHAVVGLTRNTAVELGQFGIRVNSVSPYVADTPMARKFLDPEDGDISGQFYSNLKGTALRAEDVAEAALYLASDESKYVSGHNLMIDGGFTVTNHGLSLFNH